MRLVIPETLYQDILHHYHVSLEGGHQGIGRTYQRIRDHFHWRGLYKSVQRYVGECVDCETGKSKPRIQGESPGFMSDFFRAFNKILGQRQRATMAYRPQANGSAERMVQTATRAIEMYVQDLDQRDWD
ncbi:Reverse transcriptase, partial [Phytophthora palmivora]